MFDKISAILNKVKKFLELKKTYIVLSAFGVLLGLEFIFKVKIPLELYALNGILGGVTLSAKINRIYKSFKEIIKVLNLLGGKNENKMDIELERRTGGGNTSDRSD